MSRCFPYPPPGYTPSRASKEALIESIKLQKEPEKAKAQCKKEKRRKKEYERKERKDERNVTNEKIDLDPKKRRKREDGREERKRRRKKRNDKPDLNSNKSDFPNGQIGKRISANSEQLEGSGLTEEYDQPIHLNIPSTSSESTENSSKRMRPSSPAYVIRGHGTIIRIHLSSKKQNLSDISIDEQHCSTSGRTDIPPLRNRQPNICALTEKTSDFDRTDEKHLISTSIKSQPVAPAKTGAPSGGFDPIEGSKKRSKSLQYKTLIDNWVPPSLQDAPSSPEDLDWLICSSRPERRQNFQNDGVFCSSSSSLLQPRAQLLTGIDVYALPFTVPY